MSDDAAAILARRARTLAKPAPPPPAPGDLLELLVLTAAGARYAVEAGEIVAVLRTGPVTRLPSTPPFVVGVIPYRGGVMPVLDLARVSRPGLVGAEPAGGYVVAIGRGADVVGVRAETIEMATVRADEVSREPAAGTQPSYVRAVTADGIAVLAGQRLADAPELTVQDELPPTRAREV